MSKNRAGPSMAWRKEIFESPPRRNVDKDSKTTTRIPIYVAHLNRYVYAEGGHEATALLILKYLQANGYVSRFKEQAFALHEIGGPQDRVPDILVELASDSSLHVIQCKSSRFLTEVVQNKLAVEKEFLEECGFHFHIWTDKNILNRETFEAVRAIDRGFRFIPDIQIFKEIEEEASKSNNLGQVLEKFGWDDSISAAAHGIYFINILEKLNEKSPITNHFSCQYYNHLFKSGSVSTAWWELLAA